MNPHAAKKQKILEAAEKQKVIARAVKKAREESLLAPNNIEDITHNVVKESNVEIGKLFELNRKYNGLAKKITASRMPSNHLVMNQYNAVIDTLNNELGNNNSTDELELSIEHVKKKLDEHIELQDVLQISASFYRF